MGTKHIATAEAGPHVADIMLADPTAVGPDATVADARKVFESPRQKLLIVCDGTRYLGAVRPDSIAGEDDATRLADLDAGVPTLAPDDPTDSVYPIVAEHGLNRIPVVDAGGELLGLVCFNKSHDAFCVA